MLTLGTGGWMIDVAGAVEGFVACTEQPGCATGQLVG